MSSYTYVAKNSTTGQKSNGEIEADSERAAARLLLQKSLIPLELKEAKQKGSIKRFKNKVKTKQKVIFSRQLSTLLNAGLPLVQSLTTVMNQTDSKVLKDVISKVINDVQAGARLSDSMAKHPEIFDNIYISLISAGEESGTLAAALDRIALQQEKDSETLSKVKGAMMYPVIVMVVLSGVMLFMLTTLLPQVETLYSSLKGAQLPLITRMLIGLSNFVSSFWWLVLLVIVGAVLFLRYWIKTVGGRATIDGLKMHMPVLGPIFMKLYMARFARTGTTLASSGVPMLEMLSTTASGVGNVHVASSIGRAIEDVKGGKTLSESLRGDPSFLDLVPDMIHIGEQSGELDNMLAKVADY